MILLALSLIIAAWSLLYFIRLRAGRRMIKESDKHTQPKRNQDKTPNNDAFKERITNSPVPLPVITCEGCMIYADCSQTYYRHLGSDSHLVKARYDCQEALVGTMNLRLPNFLLWDADLNERSIVVTNLEWISSAKALLMHFVNYGLVTNYIADPQGHFAIIQFYHACCIKRILKDKKSNRINGGCVRVRCKNTVSLIEWTILLDLDGVYDRTDQPFFIHHCELMSSFQDEPLHSQFLNFLESCSLGPTGIQVQRNIYRDLSKLLKLIFPNMHFQIVQPQVQGLIEADPLFEVFLDPFGESTICPRQFVVKPYHHSHKYQIAIGKVSFVLSSLPDKHFEGMIRLASEVLDMPEKKFQSYGEPLDALVFTHHISGMKCKINFDDPMACYVGALMELMVEIEPILIPMTLAISYWSRVFRFTQQCSGISAMLTMMLLVFLMKKNFLPSVRDLQRLFQHYSKIEGKLNQPQEYLQGWKIGICTDLSIIRDYLEKSGKIPFSTRLHRLRNPFIPESEDSQSASGTRLIFTYLQEFFGVYAWTNFKDSIISPFLGDVKQKAAFFQEITNKPFNSSCKNRKQHPVRNHKNPLIPTTWSMMVQHPFELSRNLAENCSEVLINKMQIEFRNTAVRIEETLAKTNPQLGDIFPDFYSLLNWEPCPKVGNDYERKEDIAKIFYDSFSSLSGSGRSTLSETDETDCESTKTNDSWPSLVKLEGGNNSNNYKSNKKKEDLAYR